MGGLGKHNYEEERKHGTGQYDHAVKMWEGLGGKYNYEEERKHGTGQKDKAVKIWEGLGNTIMRRKGSMGLANKTIMMRKGSMGLANMTMQ